jgi:serine/threonine protein kinase
MSMIGSGTYGKLYDAVELHPSGRVTIKVKSSESNWKRDVEILKRLTGKPNVTTFHWGGQNKLLYFVVMDEMYATNLDEIRKSQPEGKFSPTTTFRLAEQMLTALQSLNEIGYIHTNLKPVSQSSVELRYN